MRISIAKPILSKEEIKAVNKVLISNKIASGEIVKKFEENFAKYIGTKECVMVSNGTVSLDLALKVLDIKNGDEVLVPDFTFISTANCILFQNARPIFVDINEKTFNIDVEDLKEKITSKTKAVVGVHLFGQPFDIKEVKEICRDKKLFLIEDCAQAHGAEYKNKKVGSFGDLSCFSFYATKNMTTGEGGAITTNNKKLAKKLRLLINHGQTKKYQHSILGYNYRLTNIQAAMGLCQLKKLDKFNEKRIKNAHYLNKNIKIEGLTKPYVKQNVKHVFHQYVVKLEENFGLRREEFCEYLRKNEIDCAIHYPSPIHKQPLYRNLGYSDKKVKCPVATEIAKKVLSLPVHPGLKKEDLEYMVKTINKL